MQVSDKRKSLLDEISTTLQQKCDQLQKELEENLHNYQKTTTDLKMQLASSEV